MKHLRWRPVAVVTALTLSAFGLVGLSVAGAAGSTPTFEPDTNAVGTVSLYNAAGTQITSGVTTDTPFATYYKASGPKTGAFTFNLGNVTLYTPQDGVPTASWTTGEQITSSENYTTAQPGYPAGLNNPATNVVIKGLSSDNTMASHISNFPSASVANAGVYQIRVYTSTAATTYYTADIKVTGTAWTQVYPTVVTGTATTMALSVSPSGSTTAGTSVTLSATVSPSGAVGAVQFLDGATAIGSPVAVVSGVASTSTTSLAVGSRSLTARFVPTDSAVWSTSTSSPATLIVTTVPATVTTTTLSTSPTGPVQTGTPITLSATVTPSNAVGSIQFSDGVTALGATVPLASGSASLLLGSLSTGSHGLKATFVPSSATFAASLSSVVTVVATAAPAVATSLGLVVTPAGPVTLGTAVVLKATVGPVGAAGKVTFKDGATTLGQGTVTGGIAQLSVTSLIVGDHVLSADFVPTTAADFLGSSSDSVPITVTVPPPGASTVSLTYTPAGPVALGTAVTLTASVTPSSATGTVQFLDANGTVTLGAPVTLSHGAASATLSSLVVGSHPLSVSFVSSSPSVLGSVSGTSTLLVTTATTTAAQVSPTGPVAYGTSVSVTGTVTPSEAAGTVQVLDGTTVVGSAPVIAGQATVTVSALSAGSHALKTRFVPTDATVYAGSVSSAVTLVVSPPPAQATTSTLTITPQSASAGSKVVLRATVTPASAAGVVTFTDGVVRVGSATVVGGQAQLSTTKLALGTHLIVASFAPKSSSAYQASTSAPGQLTITNAAVLAVTNTSGAPYPSGAALRASSSIVVSGTGFAPGEVVTITVRSTPIVLGHVSADSVGGMTTTVTLPSTLSAGVHTITASSASTQVSYSFTIAAAPAASATASAAPTSSSSGSGSSGLSDTGAHATPVIAAGVMLLLIGLVLVLGGRRRRGART